MSFLHGNQARVYANGFNITNYLTEFSTTINGEAVDVTTLGATWHDVIAGLTSATISGSGFVDPAQEAIMNALTNVLTLWLYFPQGDTVGQFGYGFSAIQTSYNPTSPIGGASTFSIAGTSRVAGERVVSLHALGAETADGDSATVDNGAASAAGSSGYLEVTAFSGFTNIIVKVQHSTDNSIWVDLITFATVTAANAKERLTTTGTVHRYVQSQWTKTGTGSATFVVGFSRK